MKSRLRLYDIVYSFAGAFLFIVGKVVYDTNRLESFVEQPGYYIVRGAAAWIVILAVLLLTEYLTGKFRIFKKEEESHVLQGKEFLALMLITVVVYSLCYLAYFPGIFSYDIMGQVDQVAGISPYCNYQPVVHTLLWGGYYISGKTVRSASDGTYDLLYFADACHNRGLWLYAALDGKKRGTQGYCPAVLGVSYFYADIADIFDHYDKRYLFFGCADHIGDVALRYWNRECIFEVSSWGSSGGGNCGVSFA